MGSLLVVSMSCERLVVMFISRTAEPLWVVLPQLAMCSRVSHRRTTFGKCVHQVKSPNTLFTCLSNTKMALNHFPEISSLNVESLWKVYQILTNRHLYTNIMMKNTNLKCSVPGKNSLNTFEHSFFLPYHQVSPSKRCGDHGECSRLCSPLVSRSLPVQSCLGYSCFSLWSPNG